MGGGASTLDNEVGWDTEDSSPSTRYYCHTCHRTMNIVGMNAPSDIHCPLCESTFLEQLPQIQRTAQPPSTSTAERVPTEELNTLTDLNESQSRRLNNAAFMLRMLENRLRDELQLLQRTMAEHESNIESAKSPPKLSLTQISKLKTPKLSVDLCCAQPSCPLCMEEYRLDETSLTQLPCSHIYHEGCVMQWLNQKHTCPICREAISNEIPTVLELEARFSEDELLSKIQIAQIADADGDEVKSSVDEGTASTPASTPAAGGGTEITGIINSTLARRLSGATAGLILTTSDDRNCKEVINSNGSDIICMNSPRLAGQRDDPPLTPSKRALAEELLTIVKSVDRKEREKLRSDSRSTGIRSGASPLRLALAAGMIPARSLVMGGPIPISMQPIGGLVSSGTFGMGDASLGGGILRGHSFSNPFHAARFSANSSSSAANPSRSSDNSSDSESGEGSQSNRSLLLQLRALNHALESHPGDQLPDISAMIGQSGGIGSGNSWLDENEIFHNR